MGMRLGFVLFSQLLFVAFLTYNYIVFYATDKIVLGFFAVVSAVAAIGAAFAKFLPSNPSAFIQNYAYFVIKNIKSFVALTAFVWLLSIGWTYKMSNDLIGRLVYVKHLQESLSRGALDLVSLPDPEELADAFKQFPDRREVPFLLVRSSRLLFQAGRADIFRAFQRAFLEKLELPEIVERLCDQKRQHPRHDSLSFLLSVVGEAYSPNPALQGDEKLKDIQAILAKNIELHDDVARCSQLSFETQFQLIKSEDGINELENEIGASDRYDIDLALHNLEIGLAGPDHRRILDFWQSHGAQEYLDFRAYRQISKINATKPVDRDPKAVDDALLEVTRSFDALLLLRQSALKPGEVQWSAPPQKLILFYGFMLDANLRTLVWSDMAQLFETTDAVTAAMKELTNKKAFDEFRSPRGWFAGTPLDFGLNGSAAADKVNAWLKADW